MVETVLPGPIPSWLITVADQASATTRDLDRGIDRVERHNTQRVLSAFARHGLGTGMLDYSSGYGYDSPARNCLDLVWADVMGAAAALVRPQIVTGTHALVLCLRALLRPGDTLLSITGAPYGTLRTALAGPAGDNGLLTSRNVSYRELPLCNGRVDMSGVRQLAGDSIRVVLVQRSRGYELRPALTVAEIAEVVASLRASLPDVIVVTDNCYGEFVERAEPPAVGADLIAGSLMKNPGGGLAPTGGYVAGTSSLVEQVAWELTAPGQGSEVGPLLDSARWLFQGLMLAPHVVAQSLKAAVWGSRMGQLLGIPVDPEPDAARGDIVQCLQLGSEEAVLSFCRGIQSAGPMDANARPVGAPLPGYDCPIVMAGGTFVQGSSIELSADGPLCSPWAVYVQGGLSFEHARLAYLLGFSQLAADGHLDRQRGLL